MGAVNSHSAWWARLPTAGRLAVSVTLVLLVVLPAATCQSVAVTTTAAVGVSSQHGPGHDPVCEQAPVGTVAAPSARCAPPLEPSSHTIGTAAALPSIGVPVVDGAARAPLSFGHRLLIALGVLRA